MNHFGVSADAAGNEWGQLKSQSIFISANSVSERGTGGLSSSMTGRAAEETYLSPSAPPEHSGAA